LNIIKPLRYIMILLIAVIALSSCQDQPTTTVTVSTTTAPIETVITTSSVVTTSYEPEVKNPPMLPYAEETVSYEAFVKVPSESYISGTLLNIKESSPYQYNIPTLVPSSKIAASINRIPSQNLMLLYGNKSQNYLLKSATLFFKADAFPYLDAMMNEFAKDSGNTSVQIVKSYLYSDPSTLSNEFVTGYCVAVNLFKNGATYSLTSSEHSFVYQDKTVTCLDWFIDNCARFGFIYTGLTGSQAQALATFRFVGVPHALIMQKYDIIDIAVYVRMIKETSPHEVIVDPYTERKWTVFYENAQLENVNTVISVPFGADYVISGDNIGGFIIAYSVPEKSE